MQRAFGVVGSVWIAALVSVGALPLTSAAAAAPPAVIAARHPSRGARAPATCPRSRQPVERNCGTASHDAPKKDRDDRRDRDDHDHDKDDHDQHGGGGNGPCTNTAGPVGALSKQVTFGGHTYTADPGGLTVSPGTVVTVTIASTPRSYDTPAQIWDCLFVGHPPALGGTDLGPAYDKAGSLAGTEPFTTSFTVPGQWEGETICDRGKASGGSNWDGGTLESNEFCFFVEPPAVVSETPWPALFVVLPMLAGGVALVVARRRRATPAT